MKQMGGLNRRLAVAAIALNLLYTASAQQRHEFSVKDAVDYGTKNSVQVKNLLIGVQLQQQQNREISSAAYPQLTGSVNATDYLSIPTSLIPGEFFGQPAGTYVPVKFGTKYNATYGFNVSQTVFDGQVLVGLQARRTAIDYAMSFAAVTQEMIKANIYKVYYGLLVGRKQMGTIDANITSTEKQLHDTKEMFKNGFAEKLDVNKTEVQLANLRTEKEKTLSRLNVGVIGLKILMGMPAKDELILTDTVSENDIQAELIDQPYTYNDRKEFQQLQYSAKLGGYNIKRYKLSYFPIVSVTGAYNRNAQRSEFNFLKTGQPWFKTALIGLNINVPIFDGFAKAARVKTARLQLEQIQNNIEGLKIVIDNEVDSSRANMKAALATLNFQRSNVQLAEEVYNQTNKKYEAGLGSNLEIANVQAQLIAAQNNYYGALIDAIVAKIDYLKAVGKL